MALAPVLLNTTSEAAIAAATVEDVTEMSEFDQAFAQITAAEAAASAAPVKTDGEAGGASLATSSAPVNAQEGEAARETADKTKEVAATEATAAVATEPTAEEKAAQAEAAKAEAATKAQSGISDDEFVRRLAGLINKPQVEAAQEAATQQVEQPFRPQVTQEIAATIKAYAEEFPDVMKGEQAVRMVEMQHFAHYIFTEISKVYQPFIDQLQIITERTHLGDIQAKIPDYATITRAEVQAWAATQPDFIREGMESVIKGGRADQVTKLITMYKAANPGTETAEGGQTNGAQANGNAVVQMKTPAVSAAVKSAAAKLAPVASKLSGSPQGVSPTDYDGSFEYFSKLA